MSTAFYLHGLASSPGSAKAAWLRIPLEQRGWTLICPDLNVPSFEAMRISAQVEAIEEAWRKSGDERPVLFGSSLGALSTLLFAHRHPERVSRIVLLAPALDFIETHLTRLCGSTPERWAEEGFLPVVHYDGILRRLGHQLALDAAQFDFGSLSIDVPCLVIHGTQDLVVPFEPSQRWCQARNEVELVPIVDGDHSLLARMDEIWQAIERFVPGLTST